MTYIERLLTQLLASIAALGCPPWGAPVDWLLQRTHHRVNRLRRHLLALIAKWRAGRLPKPRPPRPGRTSKPNRERPKFPTGHGWLTRHGGNKQIGAWAGQLYHQFHYDAEFTRFFAEVPQAGRYIRPLCHMLGIELPDALKREPPKRKPRPPKPRKPRLPPLQPHASTSPLHLRLEVPGIPNARRRKRKKAV